jgi:hypothetical protein
MSSVARKNHVPDKPTNPRLPEHEVQRLIKAAGRPSSYKPEYCEQVIQAAAQGYSMAGFAGLICVSRNAIHQWRSSYPDFDDACRRANMVSAYAWEDKALNALESGITGGLQFIALRLKNIAPDDWKERIETTVDVGKNLASLIEASMSVRGRVIDVTPEPKALTDQRNDDET